VGIVGEVVSVDDPGPVYVRASDDERYVTISARVSYDTAVIMERMRTTTRESKAAIVERLIVEALVARGEPAEMLPIV
jgi:hypothetical protein